MTISLTVQMEGDGATNGGIYKQKLSLSLNLTYVCINIQKRKHLKQQLVATYYTDHFFCTMINDCILTED